MPFGTQAKSGESPSVFVNARWNQRVKLLPNRGESAVNILEHTLNVLNPKNIAKLPGFISFANTKLTLLSYDFRSAEVLLAVKELLSLGVHVQVVGDPSTVIETKLPSKDEQASWSDHQKSYFLRQFDGGDSSKGKDGKVDQADMDAYNHEKRLGLRFWSELEKLQKKHKRLELLTSPEEVVPVDDDHRFPRLQHIKALMLQFSPSKSSKKWNAPVYLRVGSSNFTDAGMDPRGRIKPTDENIEQYFADPQKAERAGNSRGHVQFNVEVRAQENETFIGALVEPIFELIEGFKQGKHFDELPVHEKRLSRVIFSDGSTLQAFYSEGPPRADRPTEDPLNRILSLYMRNPAMKLLEVLETQFVFTHHKKARFLRKLISRAIEEGTLEDLYVVVDGSFSTIKESALDDLFFSEEISISETLSGRGILNSPKYPEGFDWRDSAYSYHGIPSLVVPPRKADKMHAKTAGYRYIDDHGDEVSTIVAGSGNSSTNAGRGNSDLYLVLESRDPKAWATMKEFQEGIKQEEEKRLYRLSDVWLVRALGEAFSGQIAKLAEANEEYFRRLSDFLSGEAKSKESFALIFKPILAMKAISSYGKNIQSILKWINTNELLSADFSWADFDLLLRFADHTQGKTKAFLVDLRYRWIVGRYPPEYSEADMKKQIRNFVSLAKKIDLANHGPEPVADLPPARTRVDKVIEQNMGEHCEFFLNVTEGFHPMEIYRLLEVGE